MEKVVLSLVITDIEEDGFHIITSVKVNGKAARLLIDTGASKSVFDVSRILHFIDEPVFEDNDQLSTGLGTSEMKSQLVTISKLELGKIKLKDFKAVLIDLTHVNQAYIKLKLEPIDGVIGGDILTAHNAVIDFGKKKITLSR